MPMQIRPAIPADFPRIAELQIASWRNSYADVFSAELLQERIAPGLRQHWQAVEILDEDVVLVAETEGLVGFIAVWCRPFPFIDSLHVKPSCRSQKVGTALMQTAAKELLAKGQSTGYLWAFASNAKAIRFYEGLGGAGRELMYKDLFGCQVLNRKIAWDDLSVILKNSPLFRPADVGRDIG
jgi:ribosomal protein S18 acetylase RimI-like enzyme